MRKCVFFDIDGTIVDIMNGIATDVPEAIRQLTGNGHLAFICTGRSRAFIPREIEELPFTGMITNLGGYIELMGMPLYDYEIPVSEAFRAVKVLRENGIVPVMEGNHHVYYDPDEYTCEIDWYVDLYREMLGDGFLPISGNEENIHINKISAKLKAESDPDKAFRELENTFDFVLHEAGFVGNTVECVAKGHSKGAAIISICDRLGVEKSDRIAFGDSNNDLPMFEVVQTGVAMGDGSAELRKEATYVTGTMDKGGISAALRYLGLI